MKEQDKMESEVEINELNKKAGMIKNVNQFLPFFILFNRKRMSVASFIKFMMLEKF